MKRLIVVCLISLLAFSGCAGKQLKEEKSAQELASEGMKDYKKKNYRSAIVTFEKLKDWYPFNKLANLAELKIADAHYQLKEYDEAVMAYSAFENLHPRNDAIPYVIYQVGRCFFDQLDTTDRDQSVAQKALNIFVRLTRQFPQDPYTEKAGEHIAICLKSLAENEFYVGLFYYKSKHYKAALNRFTAVLTNYPDVGVQQKALQYIALCEGNLKNQSKLKN